MVKSDDDAAKAAQQAARQASWDRLAMEATILTGQINAAVVPYQGRPVVPPPPDKIAAFEANLRAALAEAFADPPPEPDMDLADEVVADPSAVGEGGCTACQGACCIQGGDTKAFIAPRMMARQRLRYPDKTPEDFVQFYMGQIPEASTEGGCVYQGPQGCVLRREDRARICNSYNCWNLKQAMAIEADNPGEEIALAASIDGKTIDNMMVVKASPAKG